jgi:hypothetical protein
MAKVSRCSTGKPGIWHRLAEGSNAICLGGRRPEEVTTTFRDLMLQIPFRKATSDCDRASPADAMRCPRATVAFPPAA